jgi:hypothetical protein
MHLVCLPTVVFVRGRKILGVDRNAKRWHGDSLDPHPVVRHERIGHVAARDDAVGEM